MFLHSFLAACRSIATYAHSNFGDKTYLLMHGSAITIQHFGLQEDEHDFQTGSFGTKYGSLKNRDCKHVTLVGNLNVGI